MRNKTQEMQSILKEFGLNSSYLGAKYLEHALKMAVEREDALTDISKHLYVDTAKNFNTSASCVERDIRTVIKIIWERGDRSCIEKITGYTGQSCPTNSEFIRCMVSYFRG